jgi:hypothetical protein
MNMRTTFLVTSITILWTTAGCNNTPVAQDNPVTQQTPKLSQTANATPDSSLTPKIEAQISAPTTEVKPPVVVPKVSTKSEKPVAKKRRENQTSETESSVPRTEQKYVRTRVESAPPIREEEEEPTVRSLSGQSKSCDVYSSKTGRSYSLEVDFEGATARINFPNGGYKYVDIDSPDSTNFKSISATDRDGESWDISVDSPPTN